MATQEADVEQAVDAVDELEKKSVEVEPRQAPPVPPLPAVVRPSGPLSSPEAEEKPPQASPSTPRATTPATSPVPPTRNRKRKVVPLKCSEVRWFYRKKKADKWTPFKGYDSLRLEVQWRRTNNVDIEESVLEEMKDVNLDTAVVLNGLYMRRQSSDLISALYWKEDDMEITRGTWFLHDWSPLEPELADAVEKHHQQHFHGQTIPDLTSMFTDKETKKPLITELQLESCEVRWNSVIDIFLYSTSKTSRLWRYIAWGKGTSLRRGYSSDADFADGRLSVSHLVLIVHGIGQKGYENLIAKNTSEVREAVEAALERHWPDEKTRPMILPIEWRSALTLDNGETDVVTLPKMSNMRHALNSTAMDIMYYQSPLYRKEIVGGVVRALNSVYSLFMTHNPTYKGPVSLFAHSLGSVISYDILTNWSPLLLYDHYVTQALDAHMSRCTDDAQKQALQQFQNAREELVSSVEGGFGQVLMTEDERLLFKVKYLFCVGSPMAVFLIMRGAKAETVVPPPSQLERIFNIFHPYDPVAYRLEPLFAAEFRNIRPVKLYSSHDLRSKNDYDALPMEVHTRLLKKQKNKAKKTKDEKKGSDEVDDEEDEVDSDADGLGSGYSSPRSITPPPEEQKKDGPKDGKKGWWFGSKTAKPEATDAKPIEAPVAVVEKSEVEKLLENVPLASRPSKRMDFQVQPALTDKSYWSLLKSHFSYWTNPDVAAFLANQLLRDR